MHKLLVQTDHIVLPHGTDRMVLGETSSGQAIIVAQRDGGQWEITSPWTDAEPVVTDLRTTAVDLMIDMALAVSPGTGYSTLVPEYESPAGAVSLRDIP